MKQNLPLFGIRKTSKSFFYVGESSHRQMTSDIGPRNALEAQFPVYRIETRAGNFRCWRRGLLHEQGLPISLNDWVSTPAVS